MQQGERLLSGTPFAQKFHDFYEDRVPTSCPGGHRLTLLPTKTTISGGAAAGCFKCLKNKHLA